MKKSHLLQIILILVVIYLAFKLLLVFAFNLFFSVVPPVQGQTVEDAKKHLTQYHLKYEIAGYAPSAYPENSVYLQQPDALSQVKQGRIVKLWLSSKQIIKKVPPLEGLDYLVAEQKLSDENLNTRLIYVHNASAINQVIASDPVKDSLNPKNNTVTLLVSAGKTRQMVIMPDLIGLGLADAKKLITHNNLVLGSINYVKNSFFSSSVIVDSVPDAGSKIPTGTVVNMTINE